MDTIIDLLCRVIAAKAGRERVWAPTVLVLWSYLRRFSRRFGRLLARIDAGVVPARPRGVPRRPAAPRESDQTGTPPRLRLPRGFGWLCRLGPEVACCGGQLTALLSDPELAALLADAPQVGRLLRPVLRMLGQSADLPALARKSPLPPPCRPALGPDKVPGHAAPLRVSVGPGAAIWKTA